MPNFSSGGCTLFRLGFCVFVFLALLLTGYPYVSSSDSNSEFSVSNLTWTTSPRVVRGPYLQRLTRNSATIRWRTDVATDSRVRYSRNDTSLHSVKDSSTVTKEHSITISGLAMYGKYFYTVGTRSKNLTTPVFFHTLPDYGHPLRTRVWVLGDSGTGTAAARQVRDAYYRFNQQRYTNVMLFLGGNAYRLGSDASFQANFFNLYSAHLRRTAPWPAIGEQDSAGMLNPPAGIPYFQIFDLPESGESGGEASGTESYYSFDYGTIHFVCLDSMTSSRAPDGDMLTWLKKDLAANKNLWLIAYWHHSPYSKGSHDSDREVKMVEMRKNALRILEYYGADLVLSAHSNSYERSYLLNGHYGWSRSLTASMIRNPGSGRVNSATGPYRKPARGSNTGTVYVVTGSSGKTAPGRLNHPAMFLSSAQLGSLVIDLNTNRMDVRFLRTNGTVGDYFTILKNNQLPSVRIVSPSNGSTFGSSASFKISAEASDPDGKIRKVIFYAGSSILRVDHDPPFEYVWSNVGSGTHYLTAVAEDDFGALKRSSAVKVTIR